MYDHIRQFILDDIELNGRRKNFISDRLGYASSVLYAFLNGYTEPSRRLLECIADFYNKALVYADGVYKLIDKDNIRSVNDVREISETDEQSA